MISYRELAPAQLIDLLADQRQRNAVIVALLGGITATELRNVTVSAGARQALIDGLKHPNSKVRWWCIQLLDHVADERCVPALLDAAQTDPTPKNRRHAIHALTCEVCKPTRQPLDLDAGMLAELAQIARLDSDLSVRETARHELDARKAKSE